MNILFIHQNMPAQFKHVAPLLARNKGNNVVFLTQNCRSELEGVKVVRYPKPRAVHPETHNYLRRFEDSVLHGQAVVRAIQSLRKSGFTPDLIIAHPGWGEALFLKDILPDVPVILFAELSYRSHGYDVGFDKEEKATLDTVCRTRARNADLLLSLEACDAAVSPTHWQKASHPDVFHSKIEVIFDGIDFNIVKPRPNAQFRLPSGQVVTRHDKVITYVSRNLEPYRGFRTFIRAIPDIQRLQPDAHILVVGGNNVSYGRKPDGFDNWRAAMEAEVSYDSTHVHFLGRLDYDAYLDVLAVSSAHIYLTYPFVLSWSCIEALAMGALVLGSDTGPVREVIRNGENGLLVDFFDAPALADTISHVLDHQTDYEHLRTAAIQTTQARYGIDRALPAWSALVDTISARKAST